jgi:hypothetical protein
MAKKRLSGVACLEEDVRDENTGVAGSDTLESSEIASSGRPNFSRIWAQLTRGVVLRGWTIKGKGFLFA